MARRALYISDSEKASSTPSTASKAFNISSQPNAYSINTKPVTKSNVNKKNNFAPKDVYMDYTFEKNTDISSIRDKLHKTLNIVEHTAQRTFDRYTTQYNRFKIPTVNDAFQKGFAHVFFVRPDCNVLSDFGSELHPSFQSDPEFMYAWKNNKNVVRQLALNNGQDHNFMLALSNKVTSFSPTDESIETDTYGKTFKGWKIAYGRNNVESKTASDISISFEDDRTLHIYQIHKLWVDYISDVYQGKKSPKDIYIRDRVLDYATACYYIITAEDGETIVFWSKYYGIFPTTVPSNQYAWATGNMIKSQQLDIKYHFSFKEDMNPEALAEFNINAGIIGDTKYVPTYDPKLGHTGTTWVGAPYIELVTNNTDPECPYTFKLRFRTVN